MFRMVSVLLLAVLILIGVAQAEEYYTWTDEDGVVHMGNAPADGSPKGKLKKYKYDDDASSARRDQEQETMADDEIRKCIAESGDRDRCYKKAIDAALKEAHAEQRKENLKQEKAIRKKMCLKLRTHAQAYRRELSVAKTDSERLRLKQKIDELERCRNEE